MSDSKVSAAQARATAKWEKNNYDRSLIRFPKGTQDKIKATGESINGFVNRLVRAALDAPQPVRPTPATTATTAADNLLQVPLSPDMIHNMDGAIRCGYSSDRVQYAIRAINTQIQQDIAAEKEKRRPHVQPAMSYTYDPYYDDPPDDY